MSLKSKLSKIKFFLGKNPKIEKKENWRKFIPEPYQAVVTLTVDFELAWTWRYSKSAEESYKLVFEKLRIH